VQKLCAKCGLPFECAAPERSEDAPDCWCISEAAWQGNRAVVQEQYTDCLCKTCLSLAFFSQSPLKSVWGITPQPERGS